MEKFPGSYRILFIGKFPNPYRKIEMKWTVSVLRAFPGSMWQIPLSPGKGILSVYKGRKEYRGMTVYLSSFPGVYPLNL